MKTILIFLITFLTSTSAMAQNIIGQWNGVLKLPGAQLSVVFHITKTDTGLSSTMDSPDQGAKGIPTTSTSFEDSILTITIANLKIAYEGKLGADNIIVGTFKQGGQSFLLNLSKQVVEKEKITRPQEPTKPYPYYSEDVTFQNKKDGINLAGTLTLPKKEGVFSAVILISGSGPQNRDEEILGHKPFLVLSDYLTKNGIAVLRYDDRGTAASTGDFKSATSADFATDVESAIAYLKTRKEIDTDKMGLIGHSEGGIIAPMVASKSNDVAFVVLLAGTGIPGDQLLLLQQKLIGKASGISEEDLQKIEQTNKKAFVIVKKSTDTDQLKTDLTNYIKQELKNDSTAKIPQGITEDDFIKMQVNQITSPWMQYFLKYDLAPTLKQVTVPVLALNGEKDLQVPAKENLTGIQNALAKGGNKNVTIKELPKLNHLFQEATTGAPSEYGTIEQTFSPTALTEIVNWIQAQTK